MLVGKRMPCPCFPLWSAFPQVPAPCTLSRVPSGPQAGPGGAEMPHGQVLGWPLSQNAIKRGGAVREEGDAHAAWKGGAVREDWHAGGQGQVRTFALGGLHCEPTHGCARSADPPCKAERAWGEAAGPACPGARTPAKGLFEGSRGDGLSSGQVVARHLWPGVTLRGWQGLPVQHRHTREGHPSPELGAL